MDDLLKLGTTAAIACASGFVIHMLYYKSSVNSAKKITEKLRSEARRDAKQIIREGKLEVKDQMHQMRVEFDEATKERRQELTKEEKRLEEKKDISDRRGILLEQKEVNLEKERVGIVESQKHVDHIREKIETIIKKEETELQKIAGLSRDEAYKLLQEKLEHEVEYDCANYIRRKQQEANEESEKRANDIISQAIQRCASDFVTESTVCSVSLPSDDLKGRIIGREGRNIRALEQETGVEILIDDTPNAVVISGFDPVRREVARRTLERLIADGRIHPARIEEVLGKVKRDLDKEIEETGTKTALELGLSGIEPELLKLVGRLKFRTSYGQNLLNHSVEVARIMAALSAEMHEDETKAKRAGLLHDIGKAVDHEVEGPHAQIGAEIAKRCNEEPDIVNAIASHHNEVEAKSRMAVLCSAADAISAARPGARSEAYDLYVKRIEQLETIADEMDGVNSAFAIQAGRELRVVIDAERIDDNKMMSVARTISKRISDEVQFPGQIKVCVVRETRVVEYAK